MIYVTGIKTNCHLSVYKLKGSNGTFCNSQKQTICDNATKRPSHPRVLSNSNFARSFVDKDNTTPETPKPSSAVEMIKKPKWYHNVTEKTLVSESSNKSVEKEISITLVLYFHIFFIASNLGYSNKV